MPANGTETPSDARRSLRRAAAATAASFITMTAFELASAVSSLPYLYVSDAAANCGARFLVHHAGEKAMMYGVTSVVIGMAGAIASEILKTHPGWARSLKKGFEATMGAFVLFFLLEAYAELNMLKDPPKLPPNPASDRACIAMGK